MAEKTKCAPRTHSGQYELYLSYITDHKKLRTGDGDPGTLAVLWSKLAPTKSCTEWQNSFRAWKNQVWHKACTISDHARGTGGSKSLTDLESRALSLWGREVLEGSGIGQVRGNIPSASLDINDNMEIEHHLNEAIPAPSARTPKKRRTQMETQNVLERYERSDEKVAAAFTLLANRICDLAESVKESNAIFKTVVENQLKSNNYHEQIITMLMEKSTIFLDK